jgi:hypothetical protein
MEPHQKDCGLFDWQHLPVKANFLFTDGDGKGTSGAWKDGIEELHLGHFLYVG